jgi:glycosyltransferase involved in cell wall biosynthesis
MTPLRALLADVGHSNGKPAGAPTPVLASPLPADSRRDLVSVVVPVFNVAPYLGACVDSILAQSYSELEVILVNDGSTDASSRMCDGYVGVDHRVRVLHQANGGLSDARNAGLRAARGRFVCFVDGDDWAEKGMLECLVRVARTEHADVVIAGFDVDTVDDRGELRNRTRRLPLLLAISPGSPAKALATHELVDIMGYAWNKLYSRELLERSELLFIRGLSLVEDALFNASVCLSATRIVTVDTAVIHYVQRPRTTLVSKFYPNYIALRVGAIDAMSRALRHLGFESTSVDSVAQQFKWEAVRAAVAKAATLEGYSFRQRTAMIRAQLRQPAVRQIARSSPAVRRRPEERLVMFLVRTRQAEILTLLYVLRKWMAVSP